MADDIKVRSRVTRQEHVQHEPAVGEWYWVKTTESEHKRKKIVEWLACVVKIGSNYVKFEGPNAGSRWNSTLRVHLDEFDTDCRLEPNAEAIIRGHIDDSQKRLFSLMEDVKQLTASLNVETTRSLEAAAEGAETQALARWDATPIKDYKEALIKAEKTTLPELFKEIKEESEILAHWMKVMIIPINGEIAKLDKVSKAIRSRIFSIELYAGLTEEVEQIQDGAAAAADTKIHLFQRRHYMDEECLLDYQTGGMDYGSVRDFDEWLLKPQNLARILPHQRCVVAFRIRRTTKDRTDDATSLGDFIRFWAEAQEDKKTYIYMRNGERVYRLRTGLEFEEKLFPDMERSQLDGVLYARRESSTYELITEHDYEVRQERLSEIPALEADLVPLKAEEKRLEKIARKSNRVVDREAEKLYTAACHEVWTRRNVIERLKHDANGWTKWTPETVQYDDIAEVVKAQVDYHNRLGLILQGLLDRSPVFHPHPGWQLWTPGGFESAFELVFDDARALVDGEAPDFEAYRARLNKSMKAGCVAVGQEEFWLRREAEKENERQANDWRNKYKSDYKRFRPQGDPGPGRVAKVERIIKGKALFKWTSKRRMGRAYYYRRDEGDLVSRTVLVPVPEVLNVSAYTPGDFKQFYNDPRTRADYLVWAPLLLAAEEYHAGNARGAARHKLRRSDVQLSKTGDGPWMVSHELVWGEWVRIREPYEWKGEQPKEVQTGIEDTEPEIEEPEPPEADDDGDDEDFDDEPDDEDNGDSLEEGDEE
jgi:hypothetical protein